MPNEAELPFADLLERIGQKLAQHGLKERAASLEATGSPDFIRDLRRPRRKRAPDAEGLSKLANLLGTTTDWLLTGDPATEVPARQRVETEVRAAPLADVSVRFDPYKQERRIPLLGSAVGGEYGRIREHIELTELHVSDVLEWVSADPSLTNDPDAYALTVIGDSMSPAFEPGNTVKIGPRLPVVVGDNVVVQLRGEDEDSDRVTMVLIKRLVKRSGDSITLQQFNPPVTFEVELSKIAIDPRGRPRIHKVSSVKY